MANQQQSGTSEINGGQTNGVPRDVIFDQTKHANNSATINTAIFQSEDDRGKPAIEVVRGKQMETITDPKVIGAVNKIMAQMAKDGVLDANEIKTGTKLVDQLIAHPDRVPNLSADGVEKGR